MASTVLVTGASGFTGAHCIRLLLNQGYKVKGSVRSLKNPARYQYLHDLCPHPSHPLQLVEADLNNEAPWANIVKGCDHVLHVASPVDVSPDATEEQVVKPAVEGVLMILRACRDSSTVKRVVLTSSNTAINGAFRYRKDPFTEADWGDPNEDMPFLYIKSKILAEKAAWDFVKNLPEDKKFELAVINPTYIVGPSLGPSMPTSLYVAKMSLDGMPPMKHGLGMIDVRDVAAAHVQAMHVPEMAGKRHILVSGHMWFKDIAKVIKSEFGAMGYEVNTTETASDKQMLPVQENMPIYDGSYAKKVLGVRYRPITDSLKDMAYSVIEGGHSEKKPGYTGPNYSE